MNSKPRGVFLNTSKANCSIHESGRMVYDCLKLSDKYDLDYQELNENSRQVAGIYDFYAFNYHPTTMGWLDTQTLKRLPGLKLTFILETARNNPFIWCPPDVFDVYCALDPTMDVEDKRVYAFPRPLEPAPPMRPYAEPEVPVIGSFGFATQGKGFDLVVEAVNREFDRAKIRINIPPGTYADPGTFHLHNRDYAEYLTELCQQTAKPGIEVSVTRDYMDKDELIQWCGQNTLNCFLYTRNMPGLSATTDQAISSGRPLAISTNETFRHIHPAIIPYPLRNLKESIALSAAEVLRLQKEWEPHNFARYFEKVLADYGVTNAKSRASGQITLGKVGGFAPRIKRLAGKVARNVAPPIVAKVIKRVRRSEHVEEPLPPLMQPYTHGLLQSYSQFNEDLLLDLLVGEKEEGFYVDVEANLPSFNSNTKRFYDRGWSGVNIEPGNESYQELCAARPRDINLRLGISSKSSTLTFYEIPGASTSSSFDKDAAHKTASFLGLSVTPVQIPTRSLREILDEHASAKVIDFLSVCAEGINFDVLKSNDWKKYRPALVMVEMNDQQKEILEFLSEREYILLFNNNYNVIFLDLLTSQPSLKNLLEKNFALGEHKSSSP